MAIDGSPPDGATPVCPEPPAAPPAVTVAWAQITSQKADWYASAEAIQVAENVLYYQASTGGWSPAIDMTTRTAYKVSEDFGFRTQLLFLANVVSATGCARYKNAFDKGIDRLLAVQLPNGGWVEMSPYGVYYDVIVRFIDDGMTGFMTLLNLIVKRDPRYAFVDAARVEHCAAALTKGVDFILKSQIVSQGKKAGWAAQHHKETLAPYQRSAYELPGVSGLEGVGVLAFLMTVERPSVAVVKAVHSAAAWYDGHRLLGIRVEQLVGDRRVMLDPTAPPLWARFYDIETGNPFFAGRDGVKKWALAEIPQERRAGYAWYTDAPMSVLDRYTIWANSHGGVPTPVPTGAAGATGGGAGGGGMGGSVGTGGAVMDGNCGTPPSMNTTFTADPATKPRVIVNTDGETDDRGSMIRFLLYSSDYDVAGIVQVNSRYQRMGHSGEKWIEAQIDQYEQLLPNLRTHDQSYPDANQLRSVVTVGDENADDILRAPPDFATKDTPGAQLVIDTLLDSDPRPVHVAIWGGGNTVAYALWKLKTAYSPAEYEKAVSKIRIYSIYYQDAGGYWIQDNIPGVYLYESYAWDVVWNYQSLFGPSPPEVKAYMGYDWLTDNVKMNHGALGAAYAQAYVSEGDTPSILPLLNNGLDQYTNYTLGGWGGRPVFDAARHMVDGWDRCDKNRTYWRWIPAAQNDFAARLDWGVTSSFAGANHNPVARVAGGLARTVAAGTTVSLDASPTTDPDNNALSFSWWQYDEADSAQTRISISNSDAKTASFIAPPEPGRQVHVILEVTDDGVPSLTRYQRVIVNIE